MPKNIINKLIELDPLITTPFQGRALYGHINTFIHNSTLNIETDLTEEQKVVWNKICELSIKWDPSNIEYINKTITINGSLYSSIVNSLRTLMLIIPKERGMLRNAMADVLEINLMVYCFVHEHLRPTIDVIVHDDADKDDELHVTYIYYKEQIKDNIIDVNHVILQSHIPAKHLTDILMCNEIESTRSKTDISVLMLLVP